MRRMILGSMLAAALLTLTACENKAAKQQALHGKWTLDAAAYKQILIDTLKNKGYEPGAAELARIDAEAGGRQITYEIKADGFWTLAGRVEGRDVSAKGAWWYDGGHYYLSVNEENGKPCEPVTEVAKLENGRLVIETYYGPVPYSRP